MSQGIEWPVPLWAGSETPAHYSCLSSNHDTLPCAQQLQQALGEPATLGKRPHNRLAALCRSALGGFIRRAGQMW